ncbi:hypothetical protein L7F22_038831 [Adiantum nelumboides]|nr:hypothetical protein [Adiantum nelumboides]
MSVKKASTSSNPSPPPNTALYVKNIDLKIKKNELKKQLYALCLTYGRIIDIITTRAEGMRGQAFIVFEDLASSTSALRSLDGFNFYGKPLIINYAKSKSKATIIAEKGPEALFDPTLHLTQTAAKKEKITLSSAGADLQGRERKRAREEAGHRTNTNQAEEDQNSETDQRSSDEQPEMKRRKSEAGSKVIDDGNDGSEDDADSMQMADSDGE